MRFSSVKKRKLQNRQANFRSPLSCTALRWPANVVWRLNVLPHISQVAFWPCRRTCVWKFSLIVNNLLQIGHLIEHENEQNDNENAANALQNGWFTSDYLDSCGLQCALRWSSMIWFSFHSILCILLVRCVPSNSVVLHPETIQTSFRIDRMTCQNGP